MPWFCSSAAHDCFATELPYPPLYVNIPSVTRHFYLIIPYLYILLLIASWYWIRWQLLWTDNSKQILARTLILKTKIPRNHIYFKLPYHFTWQFFYCAVILFNYADIHSAVAEMLIKNLGIYTILFLSGSDNVKWYY